MGASWQQDVALFMREVKGLSLPSRPTIPTGSVKRLCAALISEEGGELFNAMDEEDILEIADGLADLLYVTLYTANAYGLDMEPIFAEVQRSNMTKKGGAKREDGKQLKPNSYSPPDIASEIEAQRRAPRGWPV